MVHASYLAHSCFYSGNLRLSISASGSLKTTKTANHCLLNTKSVDREAFPSNQPLGSLNCMQ